VREGYFALLIPSKREFSKEYVQTIKRLLQAACSLENFAKLHLTIRIFVMGVRRNFPGRSNVHILLISAMSNPRPACGPVECFVPPSLGCRCSKSMLYSDNLS